MNSNQAKRKGALQRSLRKSRTLLRGLGRATSGTLTVQLLTCLKTSIYERQRSNAYPPAFPRRYRPMRDTIVYGVSLVGGRRSWNTALTTVLELSLETNLSRVAHRDAFRESAM